MSLGPTELIVILVIALIVFGPKRLPEVSRTVGKGLREFRRASQDLKDEFSLNLDEDIPTFRATPSQDDAAESAARAEGELVEATEVETDGATSDAGSDVAS